MKINDALALQIKTLPSSIGVYRFYDKNNKILYVGKAKNLKNRIISYFQKNLDSAKTQVMAKKIYYLQYIVVDTETDALLLENNLIKQLQPRYNILLKDDKSYPWICIKNEAFPRVFHTRKLVKDGSEYFGPYISSKTVHILLDLIKDSFSIRTCKYDLSPENLKKNKYKVCLEYHLKNCKGPCEYHQTRDDYDLSIQSIRNLLKGKFRKSISFLEQKMISFAEDLAFEDAQRVKEKINALKSYQAKSTVVNTSINNVDVFSIISDEKFAYVNFLKIINGAIVQAYTQEIKKKLNETDKDILEMTIFDIRKRFSSSSNEILTPFRVKVVENIKVTIPKLGDKKRILELSKRNVLYFRKERYKQFQIKYPEKHQKRILLQLQKDLRLPTIPLHMECFDNSNIQGTNPVAACVVFKNAKPSKKDYRHFNIKTVIGANDFASMEEVVFRRYSRIVEENKDIPELIIIDGGKGQLSSALKSLEKLGLRGKISIIGIAKKLEEIYFPEDQYPIYLDKKSESLKLIQYMRNEAHRFGIEFHRKKRSKDAIQSSLDQINGIGPKTVEHMLTKFKSIPKIKKLSIAELSKEIGKSKALKVYRYFNE